MLDIQLILGNIVALIASILMVISGSLKDRKKIIYVQTLQIIAFTISDLILGGYTGAIINVISLIRNNLSYVDKLTTMPKIILITLSIVLSICFNNLGLVGMLPVISMVSFTLLMNIKDVIKFKLLIIFTMILWFTFDLCIRSYTSAIFDFFSIIANIFTAYQLYVKEKQRNS